MKNTPSEPGLNEDIGKPKELCKCLNSLGLSSGKDSSSKICLNDEGSPCFDDKTNAETFKAFFSNLASNLVKKLQRIPHKLDEVRKYYQHLNLTEPFSLTPTSLENVLKLLEEINPSKGLIVICENFRIMRKMRNFANYKTGT